MGSSPRIGVLALQGAVDLHRPHIEAAGGSFHAVKTAEGLTGVDALILPGGESTTMLKLITLYDLWEPLATFFAEKPVWGICAGSILLAKSVHNPEQASFGVLPLTVQRNGYGRQLDSETRSISGYDVSFIRAPVITDAGDCDVLERRGDDPIWVQKDKAMAATFHPEVNLSFPSPMHVRFIQSVG